MGLASRCPAAEHGYREYFSTLHTNYLKNVDIILLRILCEDASHYYDDEIEA